MSFLYKWNVSNGDDVQVEYCWSSVDYCIKIVEMRVNGKFHRETWMSQKGRDELNKLLLDDYMSKKKVAQLLHIVTIHLLFICNILTNLQYDWK